MDELQEKFSNGKTSEEMLIEMGISKGQLEKYKYNSKIKNNELKKSDDLLNLIIPLTESYVNNEIEIDDTISLYENINMYIEFVQNEIEICLRYINDYEPDQNIFSKFYLEKILDLDLITDGKSLVDNSYMIICRDAIIQGRYHMLCNVYEILFRIYYDIEEIEKERNA